MRGYYFGRFHFCSSSDAVALPSGWLYKKPTYYTSFATGLDAFEMRSLQGYRNLYRNDPRQAWIRFIRCVPNSQLFGSRLVKRVSPESVFARRRKNSHEIKWHLELALST